MGCGQPCRAVLWGPYSECSSVCSQAEEEEEKEEEAAEPQEEEKKEEKEEKEEEEDAKEEKKEEKEETKEELEPATVPSVPPPKQADAVMVEARAEEEEAPKAATKQAEPEPEPEPDQHEEKVGALAALAMFICRGGMDANGRSSRRSCVACGMETCLMAVQCQSAALRSPYRVCVGAVPCVARHTTHDVRSRYHDTT